MILTFELTEDQAARAVVLARRALGNLEATDEQAVQQYAAVMLAKHVEQTERQIAEEEARAAVVPFFEAPEDPPEQ